MLNNIDTTRRMGLAQFIFLSLNYVKGVKNVQKKLKEKNLTFRMALYSPDWPNVAVIDFKDRKFTVNAMEVEKTKHKKNYDVLITAPAQTFFNYFMGRIGLFRPIFLGKMKVKGLFNLLKVFWFILMVLKVFQGNQAISESFFYQLYKYKE